MGTSTDREDMTAYCADCGTELGPDDKFCPSCGHNVNADDQAPRPGRSRSRWWYVGVAFPLLATAAMLILSFSIGFLVGAEALAEPTGDAWVDVVGALWALAMVFAIPLAPVALYFDREYLKQATEWSPNVLYFSVVIPILNLLVSAVYLIQRYRLTSRTPTA